MSGLIANSTIERIRELSLTDVVAKYSPHEMKRQGSSLIGLSPFSEEKTPSFNIVPSKNLYKCFSSGKGGNNPIAFVMDVKGIGFYDAVLQLAQDFTITIDYDGADQTTAQERQTEKKRHDTLLRATNRQFSQQLEALGTESDSYRYVFEYLGYDCDDRDQWEFGIAPDIAKFLTKSVIQSEYYPEAISLGLITEKEGSTYDLFRNRWVFPIYNHYNQIVGFAGRILSGDSKYPKYINSKESVLFQKSKILFGLNHALDKIKQKGFVYLVEGYTDVFTWHKLGLQNTVASCGTSFTVDQAKLLKRFTGKVVVCFDGDAPGQKKAIDTIETLIREGLNPEVVLLPEGDDPDSFGRSDLSQLHNHTQLTSRYDIIANKSIHDYLTINKHDGIEYLIDVIFLPSHISQNSHDKQKALDKIAGIIGCITKNVVLDDYSKFIAKKYEYRVQTVRDAIDEAAEVHTKSQERKQYQEHVKKNRIVKLEGNPNQFPFFSEETTSKGEYKGIRINKLKFVKLLASFGYSRYELGDSETQADRQYTFVKIEESIITHTSKESIIDELERFIQNDYDFVEAGFINTDAEDLINKLYDGMRAYFNKDLFHRVRQDSPIIINKDQVNKMFFYFSNGFVEVTEEGYSLKPYADMPGSVWNHQKLDREFNAIPNFATKKIDIKDTGVVSDFVWKVCNQDAERFESLTSIIGYLMHDFYDYKLRAINFTDSSLSEEADGRSGKTLLSQIIGWVRSYTEINGKDFNANDKGKYESADIGTQVLHINDVQSIGANKFHFESIFNDVTEGYMIKKLYVPPFRNRSKMIISSNNPIDVRGGSQKDRIIEYELSNFFSSEHSPEDEYGIWFGRDFDKEEWQKTYNFLCTCAMSYLRHGLVTPKTINLEQRKLIQYTSKEFLEFMHEIEQNCKEGNQVDPYPGYFKKLQSNNLKLPMDDWSDIRELPKLDKKLLKELFEESYEDFSHANWFTSKLWTKWLRDYSEKALGIKKPLETRANGRSWIQFVESK